MPKKRGEIPHTHKGAHENKIKK